MLLFLPRMRGLLHIEIGEDAQQRRPDVDVPAIGETEKTVEIGKQLHELNTAPTHHAATIICGR